MTTKERNEFESFKRKLQEDPVFRISFFGDLRVDMDNVGNVMERMNLQNEAENKFVCQHLGIEYKYFCRINVKHQNRVGLPYG